MDALKEVMIKHGFAPDVRAVMPDEMARMMSGQPFDEELAASNRYHAAERSPVVQASATQSILRQLGAVAAPLCSCTSCFGFETLLAEVLLFFVFFFLN